MKLFYREFGSGIPLIILHGLYGSSDNWVSIARSLSKDFRVIIPDQRNHGLSPQSKVHTYESMSSDLDELVRDLKLTKFLLIGHKHLKGHKNIGKTTSGKNDLNHHTLSNKK